MALPHRLATLLPLFLFAAPARAQDATVGDRSVHDLAQQGRVDELRAAIEADPTLVRALDGSSRTPLHLASRYGPVAAVELLIEAGSDLDAAAYNLFTPLHVTSDPAIARVLVDAGADLTALSSWSQTPLMDAAEGGLDGVVDVLIEAGAELDLGSAIALGRRAEALAMIERDPSLAIRRGAQVHAVLGSTAGNPLHLATMHGELAIVESLLDHGADVNASRRMINAGNYSAITYAILGAHDDIARLLFEHGADPNTTGGRFHETLLHFAVLEREPEIVRLMLDNGARVLAAGTFHPDRTALHAAAWAGKTAALEALCDHDAPLDATSDGLTPLHLAALGGNDDSVRLLLERGAKLDVHSAAAAGRTDELTSLLDAEPARIEAVDAGLGATPLVWAIAAGSGASVALLIDRGADVSARSTRTRPRRTGPEPEPEYDGRWTTPLHAAVERERPAIARLLVGAGADPDSPDGAGRRPLHAAVEVVSADLVRLLLEAGADPDLTDASGVAPLHEAIWRTDEVIELLLEHGADVDLVDGEGHTALRRAVLGNWSNDAARTLRPRMTELDFVSACYFGDVGAVEAWLARRPSLARPDPASRQPSGAELAARRGGVETLRALSRAGLRPDVRLRGGETLLHAAAKGGRTDVAEWLLGQGVAVDAVTPEGATTPLHYAAQEERVEMVRFLVSRGADLHARDYRRGTPLHFAAHGDAPGAATALVELGARLDARDSDGGTPLHWSVGRASASAAERLIALGADPDAESLRGRTALELAEAYGGGDAYVPWGAPERLLAILRKHTGR